MTAGVRRFLLVLACVALLATSGPGAAATTPDTPVTDGLHATAPGSQEQDQGQEQPPPGAATIQLVGQSTWVRPGENLRLTLQLLGAPADATISTEIHEPVGSRTEFLQTLEGNNRLGSVTWDSGPQLVAGLPRAGDGSIDIRHPIPAGDAALQGEGVYPVEVVVADPAGTTLASLITYMLLLPTESEAFPPLSVAVVVELGAPPALQPSGTVVLDDEDLERFDERTTALAAAQNVPLTIAPAPETLDALADDGNTGETRLRNLQSSLAGREVLARPYVDLDLDALAAANLVTEVPPLANAGAQVIRTRFMTEPLGGIWRTGPTVGTAEIGTLRDLGVGRAIVPQSAVTGIPEDVLDEGPVPTAPVTLTEGGPLAFVTDDTLASRLTGTAGRLDAQRFLAELMTMWQTRPSVPRGVVVRIPEDATLDPDLLAAALQGLADGTALQARTVGQIFSVVDAAGSDEQPVAVQLAPDTPPDDLSGLATPLDRAHADVTGLAYTIGDTNLIASLGRSLLVALGAETPTRQRRAYIDRVQGLRAQLRGMIRAPDGFTITLTARSGTIPLTIFNDTDQTVTVRVRLDSNQLEFPDGAELSLEVPPGQARHDVRVRTRTSGAFSLDVELLSPDGSIVLNEATFTIRSTAVSGVGLFLSGGAGLFLLVWWARHWRSARRSRRLIDTDPSGTPAIDRPERPRTSVARHAGTHRHRLVE